MRPEAVQARAILHNRGIPRRTAYFWIERYEISIGEKDVHPLHTRYNLGVNSGLISGDPLNSAHLR